MKAVQTAMSNRLLTLAGADDLPAERIDIYPPDVDPEDAGDVTPAPGLETTWVADEGERKAIANGAPIYLRIWCGHDAEGQPLELHPPVALHVGNPDPETMTPLISKGHVDRAVGYFWQLLAKAFIDEHDGKRAPIQPTEVIDLWEEALRDTESAKPAVDDAALDRPGGQ